MGTEHADRQRKGGAKQSMWVWLIPMAVVALVVGAYVVWPAFHGFVDEAHRVLSSGQQERIEAWIDQFGVWSFVVVLGLMLLQTILAFLPSVATMVVAVVAFGPWIGGLLTWGGLLLAASLGYSIGRSVGVASVDRLIGPETEQKMEAVLDRYGVWAVIAARISPVLSTDAVSIVAGLGRMKFLPFIAATATGTLPLTVLIAWLGMNINRLKTGLIWISVASVTIFAAYVVYDRRTRSA